jgi:hypothetical protein
MECIVRLVGTGIDGEFRSFDVMAIGRLDGLGDIANLGLTLTEAKQLLVRVQQQVVAAQADTQATFRPGLLVVWQDMSCEGLASAPDCHVVRRGETEASAVSVRRRGYLAWYGLEHLLARPALPMLTQALLQGVMALTAYSQVIRVLGVSRAVLFPAMVPVVSILVGIPIVDEIPNGPQIIGLLLVTIGLMCAIGTFRWVVIPKGSLHWRCSNLVLKLQSARARSAVASA